jgi:hypothetical protein
MTRPMPGVLKFFMVVSVIFGLFAGLASLGFLVAATAGSGPYFVQGAAVSREEFMAFAMPVLMGESVLCAFSVAAAWALWRRRYWARPLLLGMSLGAFLFSALIGTVVGMPMSQVGTSVVVGGLALLVLWWVLYRRDDVVDWFEALREGG